MVHTVAGFSIIAGNASDIIVRFGEEAASQSASAAKIGSLNIRLETKNKAHPGRELMIVADLRTTEDAAAVPVDLSSESQPTWKGEGQGFGREYVVLFSQDINSQVAQTPRSLAVVLPAIARVEADVDSRPRETRGRTDIGSRSVTGWVGGYRPGCEPK
jgi:hypothetical protein